MNRSRFIIDPELTPGGNRRPVQDIVEPTTAAAFASGFFVPRITVPYPNHSHEGVFHVQEKP